MSKFYSIDHGRTVSMKIKRSEFICVLEPVTTVADAKVFISAVSAQHRQANHNCWAYRVGETGEMSHCSDNGEPSGTAGRPMLNTLGTNGLTQVVAVVTRYFGGVKLGKRGLIDAYAGAVQAGVDLESPTRLVRLERFVVAVPYPFNDIFLYAVKEQGARVVDTVYTELATHTLEVEEAFLAATEAMLQGYGAAGKIVRVS